MVNYYELLSISQDADRASIEQAIKKTRRLWNNRANSPDASIRAEAEQHVREIAEAEKILLNDSKREEYNRQLSQSPRNDGADQQSSGNPSDWEEEYFQAYNRDLTDAAAQIAQRAIAANERNGRAWFLYGEALRRGGNNEGAIGPLQHASLLLPDDAKVYRQLGFAYMDVGKSNDSLKAFYNATNCDPNDSEYYSLRAMLFRNAEMIDEAISEARMAYKMAPNDNSVRFECFFALYEDALRSMSYNRSSGKHLIINKVQLDYVNGLLKEMALTIPEDTNKTKCTTAMDDIVKTVVDAESTKGGFFSSKPGYQYNYDISNADTRSTGKH